jgi:Icc-related predicted phosphoesterase
MILLGDLPSRTYRMLREDLGLTMRGICVLGNHDDESYETWLPRYDFEYVHLGLAAIRMDGRDITLGGFSGSERYASGQSLHWDGNEAARLLRELPGCDILVTHTAARPPEGYPANRSHMGLAEIGDYIDRKQPKIQLHGHFHRNYQAVEGQTQVIGCYGAVLVQVMITDDDDWRVEVQPLMSFAL